MALIKCKECGKEISDKAKQCVNCGCPIGSNNGTIKKQRKGSGVFPVIVFTITLLIVFLIVAPKRNGIQYLVIVFASIEVLYNVISAIKRKKLKTGTTFGQKFNAVITVLLVIFSISAIESIIDNSLTGIWWAKDDTMYIEINESKKTFVSTPLVDTSYPTVSYTFKFTMSNSRRVQIELSDGTKCELWGKQKKIMCDDGYTWYKGSSKKNKSLVNKENSDSNNTDNDVTDTSNIENNFNDEIKANSIQECCLILNQNPNLSNEKYVYEDGVCNYIDYEIGGNLFPLDLDVYYNAYTNTCKSPN